MAEPYLDRERLALFLRNNAPVGKGKITFVIDSIADRVISSEYPVALKIQNPREGIELGLREDLRVAGLLPADASLSLLEMARLNDDGELDETFVRRVEEQLKLLRFQFAWETTDAPFVVYGSKVKKREDLSVMKCHIRVQASMPARAGAVGYVAKPYISLTDTPTELNSFLDESVLDEAWRESWQGPVRRREFT